MLRAAVRRIAIIVAAVLGGTAAISVTLGALAGGNLAHSIAVGYYLVAAVTLLGCFVLGARGPLRRDTGDDDTEPLVVPPTIFSAGRGPLRRRKMRKATPEERRESRLTSLGLFALGLALVLIGSAVDPTRRGF